MTEIQPPAPEAPDRDQEAGRAALLIIDMVNPFEYPGADAVQPKALKATEAILKLTNHVTGRGWPVIYVNDNFGEWHSERSRLVQQALKKENPVTQKLQPKDEDFFIIKPQFSGFYATNLPVLLPKLGVSRLILTGIATDICVLFTAADAHMRDYSLWVPQDAVASESDQHGQLALSLMERSMGARISPTSELTLDQWLAEIDG